MEFRHPEPVGPMIAFALFADAAPALDALAASLEAEFGPVETLTPVAEPTGAEAPAAPPALVVTTQGGTVLVASIATPAPGDPVRACHPVWWTDRSAVADHRGHVLITVARDPDDAVDHDTALTDAVALSCVAAVIVEQPGAVALFHTNGALALPALAYTRLVRGSFDTGQLPVDAWVSVWLEPSDAGVTAFTLGLDAFGHAELAVADSARAASEVYTLLTSVAAHLVATGDQLLPGASLGPNDEERYEVSAPTDADEHYLGIAF
jgi:Domain of unknown function (DUF4261)